MLALVRANTTTGAPLVPGSWDLVVESGRWCTVYPLGISQPGVYFHVWRAFENYGASPPRAVYVCVGRPVVLQHLADRIAADALSWTRTWADLPTLRADTAAPAPSIKTGWFDDRLRDSNNQPVGALVGLRARMAGFDDDDAEA